MLKSQLARALQLPRQERSELDVFLRSLVRDSDEENFDDDRVIAGLRTMLSTRHAA
jgi:hypothetical protein